LEQFKKEESAGAQIN